ncbi:LuxR family transcriptional regulator [Rhodococcus sp. ABRD24]|uniref:LuxR C-terminal-related transcriptional regulator n=1 Tax=Rhodococcus sp. ABRD24 TaxID=2507582 RepID=UPI00103EAA4A|nr:LuxR C-terminal-related transcriptional regulator [Rhodococcus sp. ABRD24]QBJ96254.1 LuxR family transcriptional regulator [Rhodococcus sp. ABRD24]
MTAPEVLPARTMCSPVPTLTAREEQVLTTWLVCDSKQDVAQHLFITTATVHTHLTRIRDKYHQAQRPASSKVALLVRAIEDGYCTLHDIARAIGPLNSAHAG